MKILILGAYGMIGHKLFQKLNPDFEVFGACRKIEPEFERFVPADKLFAGIEASNLDTIRPIIEKIKPDFIINAIGITKRLRPTGPIPSIEINSLFPHKLAALAKENGARVIHFSTDCVFSGKKGSYRQTDTPDATDLYGQTKHLGELTDGHCLTIRTSIIGPELRGHTELLDWFRSQKGKTVNGFKRAIWSGFSTAKLAEIIKFIISEHPDLSGLWHIAMPPISKYELLSRINEEFGLGIEIKADENFVCDRGLDGSAFAEKAGFTPPNWSDMIGELAVDCQQYNPF